MQNFRQSCQFSIKEGRKLRIYTSWKIYANKNVKEVIKKQFEKSKIEQKNIKL